MAPKRYMSEALSQIRLWSTVAAVAIILAAGGKLLVFGFVHFTDVRHQTLESTTQTKPVIVAGEGSSVFDRTARRSQVNEERMSMSEGGNEINRLAAPANLVLSRATFAINVVGSVAAVILLLLTMLGVAVAGGGAVPGVDKAVTACVWSIILAAICFPWTQGFVGDSQIGVFGAYSGMASMSDRVGLTGNGDMAMIARFAMLPIVVMVCSGLVCWWFRAGVERGVLIDNLTDLEAATDREMAEIARQGVNSKAPRTLGALNRAIGETEDSPKRPNAPTRPAAKPEPAANGMNRIRPI